MKLGILSIMTALLFSAGACFAEGSCNSSSQSIGQCRSNDGSSTDPVQECSVQCYRNQTPVCNGGYVASDGTGCGYVVQPSCYCQ